jgi:hypothetical protein
VCRFVAAHPEGLAQHRREAHPPKKEKTPVDQNQITFVEERRALWHWLEDHPALFDGSDEAYFSTTSIDISEWEMLQAALKEACEDATREYAQANGLDMRVRDDRQEAMRLLFRDDASWAASNYDELSPMAQAGLGRALGRMKARITQGSHYGRPQRAGHSLVLDQHAEEREAEMHRQAHRHGFDMNTRGGRNAALAAAVHERPHLAQPFGKNWAGTGQRSVGVQKTIHPQLTLRRGQGPQGSPVGMPKGTLADRLDGHPAGLSESTPVTTVPRGGFLF